MSADYIPTAKDQESIHYVNQTLNTIIADDPTRLRNFKKQIVTLSKLYHMHEKLYYMLSEIDKFLENKLSDWKQEVKQSAQESQQAFIEAYAPEIQ